MTQSIMNIFSEVEAQIQNLAKSRAIQIQLEKKLLAKIKEARQAMK